MPGGNEQSFISAPLQRPTEVADFLRPDTALPALALKIDLKRHQVHAQYADTVDPAVTRLAAHLDLGEASLAQETLCQALEPIRGHLSQDGQER